MLGKLATAKKELADLRANDDEKEERIKQLEEAFLKKDCELEVSEKDTAELRANVLHESDEYKKAWGD